MSRQSNDLDQKTIWIGSYGAVNTVSKMDPAHAENAAAWLLRNPVPMLMQRELSSEQEITARRLAQILANPRSIMASTKLYKALVKRSAKKAP